MSVIIIILNIDGRSDLYQRARDLYHGYMARLNWNPNPDQLCRTLSSSCFQREFLKGDDEPKMLTYTNASVCPMFGR